MESTQKKLYEIEDDCEGAFNNNSYINMQDEDEDKIRAEDEAKYEDKFEDLKETQKEYGADDANNDEEQKDGSSDDPNKWGNSMGKSFLPNSGISVEINIANKNTSHTDSYIPLKTGTSCLMMKNPPYHIKDAEDFEPLYTPKESILEDCLRREAERVAHQENLMNRVVYDCIDSSPYSSSIEPKEGELAPFYQIQSEDDYTLVFESRFESGNLRRAIQVYEFEYDLILKPDYNTRGHTQWYYFRISNVRANKVYRFNIINLMKPDSLYNHGMRPLMYSEAEAKKFGKGWQRHGNDVCYYQNSMKRKNSGYYYTLTWSATFKYDSDCVYFAHCYPYTYTDLIRYLDQLETDPKRKNRMRRRTLCQTLAKNNVDMLVITSFNSDAESIKNRKGIVLSARVHPGETCSSYMMKGIIDYLTGPTLNAKILRDNFEFKIIPMLNPDGVINGNSRCSLAGVDLNRCWADPSRRQHPTIYHTKMLIKKFQEERDTFLVCDLHGHSRKKNVFMYGCSGKVNDRLKERIFPSLLEKNCDIFSFADCCFAIQKSKESTARVVMWKELNITNSFTLESSFCGADYGKYADFHFNTDLLQEVGHKFCETIIDFCDCDQVKVKDVLEQLEIMFPKNLDEDSEEGSNADSDFSGDENVPAAAGGAAAGQKKKKGKKKAVNKKSVKGAKDGSKEKSTTALPTGDAKAATKSSENAKQAEP